MPVSQATRKVRAFTSSTTTTSIRSGNFSTTSGWTVPDEYHPCSNFPVKISLGPIQTAPIQAAPISRGQINPGRIRSAALRPGHPPRSPLRRRRFQTSRRPLAPDKAKPVDIAAFTMKPSICPRSKASLCASWQPGWVAYSRRHRHSDYRRCRDGAGWAHGADFSRQPQVRAQGEAHPRRRDPGIPAARWKEHPPAWFPRIRITISPARWRCSISRRAPRPAFIREAVDRSHGPNRRRRIHRRLCAVVGEHVAIGRNAVLHPHVVIYEGAEIGDDFCAHSHAVVREYCRIGHRVILQNGVVVGGDGFGFAKTVGRHAFQDRPVRRHGD